MKHRNDIKLKVMSSEHSSETQKFRNILTKIARIKINFFCYCVKQFLVKLKLVSIEKALYEIPHA